jgi:hypothetical protein
VAGRFSLFTDENIDGRIIQALRQAGWDVEHAVEAFGQKTKDPNIFEHGLAVLCLARWYGVRGRARIDRSVSAG